MKPPKDCKYLLYFHALCPLPIIHLTDWLTHSLTDSPHHSSLIPRLPGYNRGGWNSKWMFFHGTLFVKPPNILCRNPHFDACVWPHILGFLYYLPDFRFFIDNIKRQMFFDFVNFNILSCISQKSNELDQFYLFI